MVVFDEKQGIYLVKLKNNFLTSSMIFRAPTGVVIISTLKQVQALHILVQKQPLRNRFVSTKTDFLVEAVVDRGFCFSLIFVSRFVIALLLEYQV